MTWTLRLLLRDGKFRLETTGPDGRRDVRRLGRASSVLPGDVPKPLRGELEALRAWDAIERAVGRDAGTVPWEQIKRDMGL